MVFYVKLERIEFPMSMIWGGVGAVHGRGGALKSAMIIGGFLLIAVGLADLALGNTNHPVLPAAIGDNLTQQSDLAVLAVGGGALWFGFTQL